MSKIHYFQRFATKENTVTNNTLQLFARIYDHSPDRASKLLSDLVSEPVEIGLEIRQQQKAGNAIPDGTLIQRSFKILIEAKVDAPTDTSQLLRHCLSFSDEKQKILLLLTKQHLRPSQLKAIKSAISKHSPEVIFQNITYEDICNACVDLFGVHDFQMQALVEDYAEYCNDANLFDQSPYLLRIVPCGKSLELNKKYGMYFDLADHGYTKHRFVGIYADKRVHLLIDIGGGGSVFDVDFDDDRFKKTRIDGDSTNKYDTRIKEMILEAKTTCGYDIAKGHRFFCGDTAQTDFRKSSKGGIMGKRLINLKSEIGDFSDVADAATKLNGKLWT